MEKMLQQILEGQAQINQRLDTIATKADVEMRILEQQKDIIALLERTASRDSIAELQAEIETLNRRLFRQEFKLIKLEKGKRKKA